MVRMISRSSLFVLYGQCFYATGSMRAKVFAPFFKNKRLNSGMRAPSVSDQRPPDG
jgi:hypothetical protein